MKYVMFKKTFYSSWRVKTFNFRNGCGKMWTCYLNNFTVQLHINLLNLIINIILSKKCLFTQELLFKNDKAIKKEITQIIEKENKLKPYSDEKIRKLLEEKDIYISRRTVTKYREECFIYNSRQRKIEKIIMGGKMMQDPRTN